MPLLDHFHPPLNDRRPWEGMHSAWANAIVNRLNQVLPPDYFAAAFIHLGVQAEVDVATYEGGPAFEDEAEGGGGVAVATWAPPKPSRTAALDAPHPDLFEVQVWSEARGRRLVAAIELVSPSNKDRPSSRHEFVVKCGSYLLAEVGLVVVDVVTDRSGDLHAELLGILNLEEPGEPSATGLYASAYRATSAGPKRQLHVWYEPLIIGAFLPKLPLWIAPNLCVAVDLEAAYTDARASMRIG